jgi:hypothetical protein
MGCLTPCIALESSMFALGSANLPATAASAVLLPTKRRFGCRGTTTGSSGTPSSAKGPKLVAALSSSIVVRAKFECCGAGWMKRASGAESGKNVELELRVPKMLPNHSISQQNSLHIRHSNQSPFQIFDDRSLLLMFARHSSHVPFPI